VRLIIGIAIAVITVFALGGRFPPEIHREVAGIRLFDNGPLLYPGHHVGCDVTGDCENVLAEVEAFFAEYEPDKGPTASVTIHTPATADGPAAITRSGGGTWMAIVTFGDGSPTALLVGCGVGVEPGGCFSLDALGRRHQGMHPNR
jgi:hypothetical protein